MGLVTAVGKRSAAAPAMSEFATWPINNSDEIPVTVRGGYVVLFSNKLTARTRFGGKGVIENIYKIIKNN